MKMKQSIGFFIQRSVHFCEWEC